MEVIQVIGQDGRINWLLPGHESQIQTPPQYGFVGLDPLESNHIGGQQYILLDDNTVVPIGPAGINNLTFLSQPTDDDSDDNEIPPHVLDHMYARKPREPGTEQVKPPRRRLKKKELIANQYFVQDTVPDYQEAPKINIIRQRLPGNSSVAAFTYRNPPKILHTSRKGTESGVFQTQSFIRGESVLSLPSSTYPTRVNPSERQKARWYPGQSKTKLQSIVLQESELPQLGALVTVGGDENRKSSAGGRSQYNINSAGRSPGRKSSSDYRMIPPAYIEVAIPSEIDSLDVGDAEGEVDDTELFLDFPMEESEEVSTLDVDFNEIPMSTSGGGGHIDGMASSLRITSSSEPILCSSYYHTTSMNDNGHSLLMGPDSSLVIKQELPNCTVEEYIPVPQYAPRRKKKSSSQSSDRGSAYPNETVENSSLKNAKSGERGARRGTKIIKPVKPSPPPRVEKPAPAPVVPLRTSGRSRRIPNRLDDEDVILSPIKRNKR